MSLLLILLDGLEFLGTPLFDSKDFFKLIVKAAFNLAMILVIVRYIYYPITKNKDYLFTYLLISLTVFLLCILLDSVKIELAFALGLFAIFGIIRYRTDPIPIKEMTYLFLVIGVSVINALANKKISKHELSAFFRKPNHNSYRPCLDQYLRNFLNGLIIHLRGPLPPKK